MAKKMSIKLVFGKSSPLMKVALLAAVVLFTVAMIALSASIRKAEAQYEAMRQQAAAIVAENRQLSDRILSLGSVESAIRIAMEELGLVEPDTTIIEPEN